MTDACHYTLNFPENLDIKVIIVKILMSISIISTKTFPIWLRCNVGLFPKSHFIKQSINRFQLKAALIGALFLVDFMYGEKPKWLSKEMHWYIPYYIDIFLPLKYIIFIYCLSLDQITCKRNIDTRILVQKTTTALRGAWPLQRDVGDSKSTCCRFFSCIRIKTAFSNPTRKGTLVCWQSGLGWMMITCEGGIFGICK